MNDEEMRIAKNMARELQGLVRDAEEAGSDLPEARELLNQWQEAIDNKYQWE